MTGQDGSTGVWCEYELTRLPLEEFDLTTQYGLVHTRSTLGVPPHSTTGLEIPGAAAAANQPAARPTKSDRGWEVPLIDEAGDG